MVVFLGVPERVAGWVIGFLPTNPPQQRAHFFGGSQS
jgi:hypothetical protein